MSNNRNIENVRRKRIEEQDVLSVEDWLHYIGNYRDDKKEKIIKFVFTWMKYNNWYSRTYNKRWDRVGAIALSNKKDAVIVYDEELKDEFISSFSNIEVSFDGKREGIYGKNEKVKVPYNVDAYCLRNFLEVVYQIRCNFFHGSKIPDSINIKLICWAYDCLDKLMKKLEDKNIIRF